MDLRKGGEEVTEVASAVKQDNTVVNIGIE